MIKTSSVYLLKLLLYNIIKKSWVSMSSKVFVIFLLLCNVVDDVLCVSEGLKCTRERCQVDKDVLKFLALGDWGGVPVWPYKTRAQTKVAEAMGYLADVQGTEFQLALGDNFYVTGVKNEFDSRFRDTFEDVYYYHRLLNTPWYVLLGNHDHHGNDTAQIAYTNRSSRWVLPDLFYTVKYQLKDGTKLDVVIIDTVVLCGQTRDGKFDGVFNYLLANRPQRMEPQSSEVAKAKWRWIESRLAESDAHYLLVAGHYPAYSIGDYGVSPCLTENLNPLMAKYNVTAYLSGHDHNLQHLRVNHEGSALNFIVSGSGAATDLSSNHLKDVPPNSNLFFYPGSSWFNLFDNIGFTDGGFVMGEIDHFLIKFSFYTGNLKQMYDFFLKPRFIPSVQSDENRESPNENNDVIESNDETTMSLNSTA